MKIYKFDKNNGKQITKFNSDFYLSRIMHTGKTVHAAMMHLEANGIIGFHQAVIPQLLIITAGEGMVKGDSNEWFSIQSGDAVFWDKDEWHETKSEKGLTAIVLESEGINSAQFMAEEKEGHH